MGLKGICPTMEKPLPSWNECVTVFAAEVMG
jgi:hypothetical protein